MRCYGLRATLFVGALCAALLVTASLWLGLVGAAAVSALLVALGWIIYFHSERKVLTALRAHPVSEVERPDLYRIVQELAFSAHLPVPRLFVSPAAQPNILTVGYSPRSAAVCCTEGLLRLLSLAELRAVLAHELAHVARRDFAVSSWSAGFASLVASCPLIAVMLHITAPSGREYGADIDGALLTGDPMALASALRKIDTAALAQPLRPRGTLAAASPLMIAHPFPSHGLGGMLSSHPPTSERVRRLEALSGGAHLAGCYFCGPVGLSPCRAARDELEQELRYRPAEPVRLPALGERVLRIAVRRFRRACDAHGERALAAELGLPPNSGVGCSVIVIIPLRRDAFPAHGFYPESAVVSG